MPCRSGLQKSLWKTGSFASSSFILNQVQGVELTGKNIFNVHTYHSLFEAQHELTNDLVI